MVYPILGLVVVANTFNVGADLGAMAASVRLLMPLPQIAGVLVIAIIIAVIEIRVPYRQYAQILRWLVLSLVAYAGVLVVVHVPWGRVVRSTFVPHFAADRTHVEALIAIFGTTISPYLFFWQAAEEVEENDETAETCAPDQMRAMRVDVVVGAFAGVAVMFAILTATAATLGQHPMTIQTADQAARALRPLAGRFASFLFAGGIVGTGLLAIPTLTGSSAYALAEAFYWREGLSKTFRQAPGFYSVIAGGMAVGVALNLFHVNPIHALFLSAILNGLAAPPIMLLMLLASRGKQLGRWGSGPLSVVLVAAAIAVMTVLPVWYLASGA